MSTFAVPYRDPGRFRWVFSLAIPLAIAASPLLALLTHRPSLFWLPVAFLYLVMPLADYLVGTDQSNPPELAVADLQNDKYYRYVTYALVPLIWIALAFSSWIYHTANPPWYHAIGLAMTMGFIGGFGINLGHELGHKTNRLEGWLARLALAPTAYGHFVIEHNRGHHRHVATPNDSASARMGENVYRFALREWPGGLRRAWALESDRLERNGLAVWSYHNEILQTALITLACWASITAWLGLNVLPFIFFASLWANFQLTTANYIEHYGLLRAEIAPGKYEACAPRHSWNSNHAFSNWALFHLQRHSDHHAHPGRRYQALRHFDEAPQLPTGYFGMFPIAHFPPLWFRVMDRRLIAAVGGDWGRINISAGNDASLRARYKVNVNP
jgi:alkane 1-monooxygenase